MQNIRQIIVLLTVGTLFFLSIFSYFQFLEYKNYTQYVEHTYQTMNALEKQESNITSLMAVKLGYMIAPSDTLKHRIKIYNDLVKNHQDSLELMMADNPFQSKNITDIRHQTLAYISISDNWFDAFSNPDSEHFIRKEKESAVLKMDAIIKELDQMLDVEGQLLKTRQYIQHDSGQTVPQILLISGLAATGMMLMIFFILNAELRERMKAKEALEKNVAQLNLANEELERFAFIASHNLKEPLRKSRTFISRTIQNVPPESDLFIHLNKTGVSLGRLQMMLDDLLTYTKILHHNEQKQRVNLDEIIKDVVAEFQDEIENTHAKIQIDVLPPIIGFSDQIALVFRHLLSNSLKYKSLDKNPAIQISAYFNHNSGHQVIRFSDNGIGFDEAFKQKIFEIFGRLHPRDQYGGTGIGLAICRRVMTNHNGHITADASPGEGCVFSLYFPKYVKYVPDGN